MRLLRHTLLFMLAGASLASWAFPDMIRHNYSNCTICHVSPTGGGVLTAYGQALSVEVLSSWGGESEGGVLHGLIPAETIPQWLNVGGDVRALQFSSKSPQMDMGRFFLMQADFETAITVGKLTVDGSIGSIYERENVYRFGSHHYWAMYQITDEQHVRSGRFFPAFGLNIPEHEAYTRAPLGFDENWETYNVELGWLNEKVAGYVTASQARPEVTDLKKEEALSVQFDYTFAQKYRVGLGRWQGARTDSSRAMTSLHGALGFTERAYFLFDVVYQEIRNATTADQRGIFVFARPGYEILKGYHLFGVTETLQSDFKNGLTIQRKLGLGMQWYPRPHFDFQVEGYKEQILSLGANWSNVWYLLFHYYL